MENIEKVSKRERSKAYPGAPLEECVQQTIKIKRTLGCGKHDRDSLAVALGFKGLSGAVAPKIAAMAYFGFLDKKGADYWLSESSRRITDPLDEEEKKNEIRSALNKPTLYSELLEKFQEAGEIPEKLEVHLHRFHGIADNAAKRAADIFRESAIYAGVINEEGRFLEKADTEETPSEKAQPQSPPSSPETPPFQGKVSPSSTSLRSSIAISETNSYTVSIAGPKIQFSVIVSDEADLAIIEAMLQKVRTFINAEQN